MSVTIVSTFNELNTIPKCLKHTSETCPDKELLVFYNGDKRQAYTVLELFTLASRFAYRLRHSGFQRYDVIANTLPNSPERAVTDLGIFMAGCAMMHGQVLLADGSDFFQNARVSKCKGVIVSDDATSPAWMLLKPYVTESYNSYVYNFTYKEAPDLKYAIVVSRQSHGDVGPLLEDIKHSAENVFVESVSPDDLAAVFCTSGSTGYSKLVPRSHQDIVRLYQPFEENANSENISSYKYYSSQNMGWLGGFPGSVYCCGATQVLSDNYNSKGKVNASEILQMNFQENCEMSTIRPVHLQAILDYTRSIGGLNRKLKCLLVAGQPVTKKQISDMFQLSEQIVVWYGGTESLGIASCIAEENSYKDYKCGKLLKGVQLRIVNEEGRQCAPRELGTIYVKGPNVFKGYFNRLEDPDPKTCQCFTEDNWFNTDDFGYLDDDGELFVLGRNKDAIIYGSVVFQPVWLENKLKEHPDVAEAILVPVSDPVIYHNICACILPRADSNLTEEKIRIYCESIFLPNLGYVTPKPGYYMILPDNFPWTANSKPDKQKLRKLAEEAYGYIGKETT